MEPAVALLRQFRDAKLLTNEPGRAFVNFYYNTSPPIAEFITGQNFLKFLVRIVLLPVIAVVYLLMHPSLLIFPVVVMLSYVILFYRRRRAV